MQYHRKLAEPELLGILGIMVAHVLDFVVQDDEFGLPI